MIIKANCLSKNFNETFNLVKEIVFEPRWDLKEFDRLKNETVKSLKRQKTSANSTATLIYAKLIYGD